MMKKYSLILVVVSILALFSSCGDKTSKVGSFSVNNFSNGKAGEVILVMDDKSFDDSAFNQVVTILQQPQPAINQIEPMFDILHFQNSEFTSEFLRHRNIIHFDYNVQYPGNHLTIETNQWSSPQVYAVIKGNNQDSMIAVFCNNEKEIINRFYQNDLKRLMVYNAKEENADLAKKIKSKFGISIDLPDKYIIAREEPDFLWLLYRTAKNDRCVMIYKTPATDLSEKTLIAQRDTMTKRYIEGAIRNAYPIVAQVNGFPIVDSLSISYKTGVEMRGLWESVGDNMGGPFYSYNYIDPTGKYCISIDGFVYAPQETKRDYLREVEAIVKSIR